MTATVRLLCLLVVLAVCATAADPALLNLARPDVNFVMGINVSQIASSPRVTTALAEARRSKPEVEQLFQILGPNPLSNLEEIVTQVGWTRVNRTASRRIYSSRRGARSTAARSPI